jgi:hypothetical protein
MVSRQAVEPNRGAPFGEAGEGTNDQNGSAGRRQDGIGIDQRTSEFGIQALRREQVAIPFPSAGPRAPISVRCPADPSPRGGNGPTLMKTLPFKFERTRALLPGSVKSPFRVVSPLRRNLVGAAVLVLVAGAIVVGLRHYLALKPSDPRTDLSGTSKLASTNPPPVVAPRLSPARTEALPIAAREGAPTVGLLSGIQPESDRDTVDPKIMLRGSSEAKTPETVLPASSENPPSSDLPKLASTYSPAVAARPRPVLPIEAVPLTAQQSAPIAGSLNAMQPESVRDTVAAEIKLRGSFEADTPASSENLPSSDLPKLASTYSPPVAARPVPVPTIEAVPQTTLRAPFSRVVRGTTASLSQSTPSTVSKTTALHPDILQPHIGDVGRRKHDQKKPSKAVETGSCTADIFPGYVQASARVKTVQLDVRKICADQHASFMVSLRCFVASIVCPNSSD